MHEKVTWGIISTGAIAHTFASALAASQTGRLVAVASRARDSANAFAKQFNVPRALSGYEEILHDKEVQAIYIATPHPMHAQWAIRAARAGKHVLVEKPLAMNYAEAASVVEAARQNNVFLMEAFMYRCHPQTAKLVELLDQKTIGDVRVIAATFSGHAPFLPASRLFDKSLGGGAILDIGCYPASIARLIVGADPTEVTGNGHLGDTGVDEWAIASLKFPGGEVAQLATGISVAQENSVKIFGSTGFIILHNPFQMNRTTPEPGRIILGRSGPAGSQETVIRATATSFVYEADVAGRAILEGRKQAEPPAMTWEDSLGNMRTLDRWRAAIGLTYECDKIT